MLNVKEVMQMSNKGRILIVDDEPFNCEIMQEILEHDYELKIVYNGQDCLDTAPQWLPDVILLDISMPGMSGYDVCKQLKGSVKTQDAQRNKFNVSGDISPGLA